MPTQNPPKIDQKALVCERVTAAHFTTSRPRRQTMASHFGFIAVSDGRLPLDRAAGRGAQAVELS
jgi:hypothetical protein